MIFIKRIFMIGFSTDKGGVESYIKNLVSNLPKEEYEVILHWPEMTIDGKKWIMPVNRHNPFKYYSFWKKFYRENHFDAVYFNTCDIMSIDPMIFAKQAGIPVRIFHSHNAGNQMAIGGRLDSFHKFTEKWNKKHIKKFATDLLACSEAAGDWMFGGHSYSIIKNGITLSRYTYSQQYRQQCRQKLGASDEFLIGCVGRLDPQKNPFYMLDVAGKLRTQNTSFKIVMIGDGELREKFKNEIAARGLSKYFCLVGAVDNVNEWMSALDCLVMPSLFEGLPFVLVEAQAAGLSCVVSSNVSREADLTGLVSYVELEAGAEKWTEEILCTAGKERPDTSQQLIDAGYSIESTAKKVTEIIENRLRQGV